MSILTAFDAGQYLNDQAQQPTRILVVDADPALRRTLVDYVDNHSMGAMSASGRQELVHLLAVREPSLVILDRQLGEENGLDLLREIRSL
jgi:two-component system OmpR family response regulator